MTTDHANETLGARIAGFAQAVTFDELAPEVVESVRAKILDTIGLCCAATREPSAIAVREHVLDNGGNEQATAIGLSKKVPASQAAFLNGTLAHALDFDDTHLPSILHPSASVVTAALATAEKVGASGAQLIAAVAIGLEVTVRLGMAGYDRAAGNSVFFEHGQHATSICGALGASVASACLQHSPRDLTLDSLGIAASMASGIIEANRTGGTVKQVHCGWAAHSGVTAAELAHRGVTGPPTVLEGRFGFFEAFLRGEFDAAEITRGLGEEWMLLDIHVKPYPANHFTHAGIDAALALRARGIRPEDVASLRLGVAGATVRTIGEPIEIKRRPATGYAAKFSGPFTVASALIGGGGLGLSLDDFTDERAVDPATQALMDRVEVFADPWCDERYPVALPASLTVTTHDGRTLQEHISVNRGGPGNRLSAEELNVKFVSNATQFLDPQSATRVRNLVADLERLANINALMTGLGGTSTGL